MSLLSGLLDWLHAAAQKSATKIAALPPPRRNHLGFLTGLLSAAAFAPLDLWPLLPVALAVLIWLIDAAPTPAQAARSGWWFSLGQLVAGLYWIAISWQYQANMPVVLGFVAVILLSGFLALYAALACGVAKRFWHPGPARIFLFAACWALGEWMRGTFFTGFPWNDVGSAWLPVLPVAQSAALVGTRGLSLLMCMFGGALALLAASRTQAAHAMRSLGISLLCVIMGGGAYLFLASAGTWPHIRVHIIQANIGQDQKWSVENFREPLRRHVALTQQTIAQRGPGIVIWPETAVPNLIDEEVTTRYLIARALGDDSILLTGGDRVQRAPDGEILAAFNSLLALNGKGEIGEIYDKVHLVPFGEYVPMRSLLDPIGISQLAPGGIDFLPGPKVRTLKLDKLPKVGPLICFEAIFPGQVVDRANRPDWLLNVSNDAWFGRSAGPYQHLAQARLRTIEEGLPMVRSTPTGVSAVIDGHGRIVARTETGSMQVLTAALPKPLPRTAYGRFGDLGFFVFAAVLLFLGARRTAVG